MTSQSADWPGKSFGAPETGPGAVAGLGQRAGGFVIDIVVAALITWIFTAPEPPQNWSLLTWSVMTLLGIGLIGQTPGHLITGTRVAPLRPAGHSAMIGLWAIPRTFLIGLLVPPMIQDRNGRGLHDRLAYTVVVRTR